MVRWAAYDDDGGKYTSRTTAWPDLPDEGIVGVVVYRDDGRRELVTGGDWYYRDDDGVPTATDTADEWGEWVARPDAPDDDIKRSGRMDPEAFDALQDRMIGDREWP